MSKLDSSSNRTIDEGVRVDKKDSNVPNKLKTNDLQPIMSDSLGNYEPKNLPVQSGPGEGGKMNIHYNDIWSILNKIGVPVILSAAEEQEAQPTITRYGFNMVASDKISMDRRIKDTRPEE